jgi:RNA polymerase sigma factor (sigma-70 family)
MVELTIINQASNEELARQAQQGCRASFSELVARFQVPLLHFLQQRTPSWQDAEDITQEVFVRAFRSLAQYRSNWRFSTWIYTIAHRLSINARRRKRPTADSRALETVTIFKPAPEEEVADADASGQLWRTAAAVLTTRQLTALWLFYIEEMPLAEIAVVVGKSPTAAKGLLFRARRKMAEVLALPQEDGPAPVILSTQRHLHKVLPPRLSAELHHG